METNGAVPLSLAAVTPEFLAAALAAPVTAARLGTIVRGTATKAVFALDCAPGADPALPRSVCVKGGLDEPHAAALAQMGSYVVEGRFYRDIRPEVAIDAPRIWSVHIDAAAGHCVIVMEDLVAAGAHFLRVTEDVLSPPEVSVLLGDLARLHARWWDRPGPAWLDSGILPDSAMGRYFAGYRPEQLAACLDRRAPGLPAGLRDPALLHEAFWRLEAGSGVAPLAVLHGDAHIGNVFRRADGRVALCDWQTMFRGRWSHDVAYLIGSGLDPALRGRAERDLIGGYLEALRSAGIDAPASEAAWAEYRRAMLYGLYGWLTNPLYFQPEAISAGTTDRFATAVAELDTIDLLLAD